jgi:hypothetical protein
MQARSCVLTSQGAIPGIAEWYSARGKLFLPFEFRVSQGQSPGTADDRAVRAQLGL